MRSNGFSFEPMRQSRRTDQIASASNFGRELTEFNSIRNEARHSGLSHVFPAERRGY